MSMDFNSYRAVLYGCIVVVLILEILFFLPIPNRCLAELIEKLFQIDRVDSKGYLLNFYGVQIHMNESRRFRWSLVIQIALIAWVIVLLFLDGCVLQVQNLSGDGLCPSQPNDCFIVESSSERHQRISCEPEATRFNSTHSHLLCFVWVYGEQNTVSVLNQIGICSSVFSLLCHTLKVSCRMSRKWWGLLILTVLSLGTLAAFIVSLVIELRISMTAKLLLIGTSILTLNVIQLFQFTHHRFACQR